MNRIPIFQKRVKSGTSVLFDFDLRLYQTTCNLSRDTLNGCYSWYTKLSPDSGWGGL